MNSAADVDRRAGVLPLASSAADRKGGAAR